MNSKRFTVYFFSVVFVLFFGCVSHVGAVSIDSFVVIPTNMPSGQLVSLSWSGHGTGGYNLYATCNQGVKIKNQDNSLFTCGVRSAIASGAVNSTGFYLINTSGSNKTVTFRLYPTDSNGIENTSGVMEQTVSINAIPYPINGFYASATSTVSGSPVVLSWSSITDIDGVNLMISCANGVTATSSVDGSAIQCGSIAFMNTLPSSGSLTLSFKNKNNTDVPITINLLPYIADTSYDLSHAQTLVLDVATDTHPPAQIVGFVSSKTTIASGATVDLSWNTKNTQGVNLKMDCDSSISGAFVVGTTTPVPCGKFIFDQALGPNATTSIVLSNIGRDTHTAVFTLFPQFQDGGFDGTSAQSISVSVLQQGQVLPTSVSSLIQTVSPNIPLQLPIISPRKKFTKTLVVGSRGDDVSALQEFLSKNRYYPEASVTGYFGPATKRAVGRFQEHYAIVKNGGAGYGGVGPVTRAKLNSL